MTRIICDRCGKELANYKTGQCYRYYYNDYDFCPECAIVYEELKDEIEKKRKELMEQCEKDMEEAEKRIMEGLKKDV